MPATSESTGPFIGRQTELRQLHQVLESVISSKQPKFVLLEGDFGMGKTSLVEKFLFEVSTQNSSVLLGRAKCSLENESSGFVPFVKLLATLTEQSTKQGILAKNALEFLQEVVPAWLDTIKEVAPDLLTLIPGGGLITATIKTIQATGRIAGRSAGSQENAFIQYTNAIRRLAEKNILVISIEDLHWADASSLKLLFHLSRNLDGQAILFVCTYRPIEAETGPTTDLGKIIANLIRYGALRIELKQGIDVSQYVAQRYPKNSFPSDFIQRVQKQTDGHPLFVDQLFSELEETHLITSSPISGNESVWHLVPNLPETFPIPASLQAVLEERLRRMFDGLREILNCAAVEGEDFTAQVVGRLRQLDESSIFDSLKILNDQYRLIRELGPREVDIATIPTFTNLHIVSTKTIYTINSTKARNACCIVKLANV